MQAHAEDPTDERVEDYLTARENAHKVEQRNRPTGLTRRQYPWHDHTRWNRPRLPAPPQLNNEGDRSRATKIRQLHPPRTDVIAAFVIAASVIAASVIAASH